jgi:hypothetical protein
LVCADLPNISTVATKALEIGLLVLETERCDAARVLKLYGEVADEVYNLSALIRELQPLNTAVAA